MRKHITMQKQEAAQPYRGLRVSGEVLTNAADPALPRDRLIVSESIRTGCLSIEQSIEATSGFIKPEDSLKYFFCF